MNQFDRLEELAQRLVEGTFNRIFQSGTPSSAPAEMSQQVETKEVLSIATHNQNAQRWSLRLKERRIQLGEPVLTIGRALNNDIILSDPTVSRYHAQLRWRNERYYLYPPQSQNGPFSEKSPRTKKLNAWPHTRVNRQSVPGHLRPLAAGDAIEFGKTHLTIEVV